MSRGRGPEPLPPLTYARLQRMINPRGPHYRPANTWKPTPAGLARLERSIARQIVRTFLAGEPLAPLARRYGRARTEAAIRAAIRKA